MSSYLAGHPGAPVRFQFNGRTLAGREGATYALALGAGFAAVGSVMSFLRLTVQPPKP